MTRSATLLAAVAAALLLAACGAKEDPSTSSTADRPLERFTLVLDYFPNADHAGIFAAKEAGEFERAGLDVKIVTPSDPAAPLKLLQAGRADLAISYEPELILARQTGAQLLAVAALAQKPLTSLMAIEGSGVRSVADLRGKTVGTAGIPYQAAYLKSILAKAKVPASSVKRVDVGFNLVPAMIGKRVDATLGAFWNVEGVDLERRGRNPTILRMERLGVPTYNELVLVARRKALGPDEASRIRRFIQAVARATSAVRDDPGAAADALVKANPDLDRRQQLAQVEATLPVLFPDGDDEPFGHMNQDEWHEYGEWMFDNGLVDEHPRAENAMTIEFLPGEGLAANTADPGS